MGLFGPSVPPLQQALAFPVHWLAPTRAGWAGPGPDAPTLQLALALAMQSPGRNGSGSGGSAPAALAVSSADDGDATATAKPAHPRPILVEFRITIPLPRSWLRRYARALGRACEHR